jgi:proline racemase
VGAPDAGGVGVTIDVPSGRIVATVRCRAGVLESVVFRNVPSFVLARGVAAGDVEVDVAYGRAIYAFAPAASLGLRVDGLLTEVEGTAFRTSEHRFFLDPGDPLGTGFVLR